MKPLYAALIAAFLFSTVQAGPPEPVNKWVDMYQVFPDGQVTWLGEQPILLTQDVIDSVPGLLDMYCQMYVHDYTGYRYGRPNGMPNGVWEAPGLLSCTNDAGKKIFIQYELFSMENRSIRVSS